MSSVAILFLVVVYIGTKPFKRDTVYGTNLTWTPGQGNNVDAQIANRMAMNHPDVYVLEDSDAHKAYLAGENPAQKLTAAAPVKTVEDIIAEKVKALTTELKNCPRVEQVITHELVAKLPVVFLPEDTKREHKENRIIATYKQYLEANADKLLAQSE
jgi:hypothetical protein